MVSLELMFTFPTDLAVIESCLNVEYIKEVMSYKKGDQQKNGTIKNRSFYVQTSTRNTRNHAENGTYEVALHFQNVQQKCHLVNPGSDLRDTVLPHIQQIDKMIVLNEYTWSKRG